MSIVCPYQVVLYVQKVTHFISKLLYNMGQDFWDIQ